MAIQELIVDRKRNTILSKHTEKVSQLYTIQLDLKTNYLDIFDIVYNKTNIKKVETVIINHALHYFAYTDSLLENIINYINMVIESNGKIIITIMNGRKVFDLLKKNNNEWKISPNKYFIEFTNREKNINEFNRYIDINLKLPFSNNEIYTEKLMDINHIIKNFKRNKFLLIEHKNFLDFKINNITLEEDDEKWVGLYDLLILQKK